MVYVLNIDGQPLMPTVRHGKVHRMLKSGLAKVVKPCPFTIQLTYRTETEVTQDITLGVDAGSRHIGLSASTEKRELYCANVQLRQDITGLLASRRELRRGRRFRKTRYRKPRFMNRVHLKRPGWLAPTVQNKIQSHLTAVRKVFEILPVTKIIVETASFDIQKIKALAEGHKAPEGIDYQQGEQLGFWNVREYVLFRDNHECQCCHGKSKDTILNVHHIESRKTGGDAPNNLITLCETCHKKYHAGELSKFKPKRGASFRDATFMGVMRWAFYNKLKELYPNISVSVTYGYITKNIRIRAGLPKEHSIDALCIAGHATAKLANEIFMQKKVRCHNRQIHKCAILKDGVRKRNQAEYRVKGFRLFDVVRYQSQECFIWGRRTSGSFLLRKLDGTKVKDGVSSKRLRFIRCSNSYLIERREHRFSHKQACGFSGKFDDFSQ